MAFVLPELNYEYDALEPVIDAQTMELHHGKHHAGYVDKLNAALDASPDKSLAEMSIDELLRHLEHFDGELDKQAVINHGGGHANHSLFWEIMQPGGASYPNDELKKALHDQFGGLEQFKTQFANEATARFGSGWAWLVLDDKTKQLGVLSTANQDSPVLRGKTPILGLDVWEHAYYLNYQNRRAEYVEKWWEVVNWDVVAEKYEEAS